MRTLITTMAVALTLPASALAAPATEPGPQAPGRQVPSQIPTRLFAPGTDVAAPDQQAPRPTRLFAPGTDVAAPDQQAAIPASTPRRVTPVAGDGFDWGDAAIGAGGLVLITAVGGLGVASVHRRRSADPVAPVR
jgi:hypothetical protein